MIENTAVNQLLRDDILLPKFLRQQIPVFFY